MFNNVHSLFSNTQKQSSSIRNTTIPIVSTSFNDSNQRQSTNQRALQYDNSMMMDVEQSNSHRQFKSNRYNTQINSESEGINHIFTSKTKGNPSNQQQSSFKNWSFSNKNKEHVNKYKEDYENTHNKQGFPLEKQNEQRKNVSKKKFLEVKNIFKAKEQSFPSLQSLQSNKKELSSYKNNKKPEEPMKEKEDFTKTKERRRKIVIRKRRLDNKPENNHDDINSYNNEDHIENSNDIETSSQVNKIINHEDSSKSSRLIIEKEGKSKKNLLKKAKIPSNKLLSLMSKLEKYEKDEFPYETKLEKTISKEEIQKDSQKIKETLRKKACLTSKCSIKEINQREEQNNLSVFEIDKHQSKQDQSTGRFFLKANSDYCIKAYVRSAADTKMNHPENIRTMKTLLETLSYILDYVIDADEGELMRRYFKFEYDNTFNDISKFIEDRFRAIRQDLTILEYKGTKEDIKCNLIIARFLVMCLNQCLSYEEFTGNQGLYKLFKDQLNKCLGSLRESLEEVYIQYNNDIDMITSQLLELNEVSEVYFYSILLNIDQGLDVNSILNKIPKGIINSKSTSIRNAIDCIMYYNSKDYYKYFSLIKTQKVKYLEACIMSIHFSYFRKFAFDSLSENGNLKGKTVQQGNVVRIEVKDLIETMLFEEEEEVYEYIKWYGVCLEDSRCVFIKERKEEEVMMMRKYRNDLFIESLRKGMKRREICLDGIDLNELIDYVELKEKEKERGNDDKEEVKTVVTMENISNIIKQIKKSQINERNKIKDIENEILINLFDNEVNTISLINENEVSTIKESEEVSNTSEEKNINLTPKHIQIHIDIDIDNSQSLFKKEEAHIQNKEKSVPTQIEKRENNQPQQIQSLPLEIIKINESKVKETTNKLSENEAFLILSHKHKTYLIKKHMEISIYTSNLYKHNKKIVNKFKNNKINRIKALFFIIIKDNLNMIKYKNDLLSLSLYQENAYTSYKPNDFSENIYDDPTQKRRLFSIEDIVLYMIFSSNLNKITEDYEFIVSSLNQKKESINEIQCKDYVHKAIHKSLFFVERSLLYKTKLLESIIQNLYGEDDNDCQNIYETKTYIRLSIKKTIGNIEYTLIFQYFYIDIHNELDEEGEGEKESFELDFLNSNYNDLISHSQIIVLIDLNRIDLLERLFTYIELISNTDNNKNILIIYTNTYSNTYNNKANTYNSYYKSSNLPYRSSSFFEIVTFFKERFNNVFILNDIEMDVLLKSVYLDNNSLIFKNNFYFYEGFTMKSTGFVIEKVNYEYQILDIYNIIYKYFLNNQGECIIKQVLKSIDKENEQSEVKEVKNIYWRSFFQNLQNGICTMKVITNILLRMSIYNKSTYESSHEHYNSSNTNSKLKYITLFNELCIKLNMIKVVSIFKYIFKNKHFDFKEFMYKPDYSLFLNGLLSKSNNLFFSFIEKVTLFENITAQHVNLMLNSIKDKYINAFSLGNEDIISIIYSYFRDIIETLHMNSVFSLLSFDFYEDLDRGKQVMNRLNSSKDYDVKDKDLLYIICLVYDDPFKLINKAIHIGNEIYLETKLSFMNKEFYYYISNEVVSYNEFFRKNTKFLQVKREKEVVDEKVKEEEEEEEGRKVMKKDEGYNQYNINTNMNKRKCLSLFDEIELMNDSVYK